MSSNLKKYTLTDAAEVLTGFPFKGNKYSNEGIRVVRGENVTIGSLRWDTIKCWNEPFKELEKYSLDEGDIVIGMDGSRVGKNRAQIRKDDLPLILAQRVARLRAKNNFSQDFLAYVIKSKLFEQYVDAIKTGTSIPHISPQQIKEFEFIAPEKQTQQRIASILSSLDDAIELNQQINKTLEEMAKAIFKEWFVDFNYPNATGKFQETEIGKIPIGWKVATFEDVFDADRGLSYKGAGLALAESEATPMHNLNSVLEGGGYKTIGIKYYNGEYKDKHIVNAGEVIVANTEQGHKYMLIGYPAIVPKFYGEHGIFSHHIYRIRPKANCYLSPDLIFHLLLQPQVRDQVVGFANGTTVNMLKIEGLKKPKFAMPPKELAEKFGAIAKANRLQAEQNIEENQSLINLRDTLLPKLMKGEININL
jgi:type I restriction enzyme S subunit